MMTTPKILRAVAIGSPVVGLGLSAGLIWAMATVRDDWDVWAIVALFYGALASAVAAHVSAFMLKRSGRQPLGAWLRALRSIVSAWVALTALWVWCAPLMHPIVGWGFRQVSVWRFGW
ncbi:MAG: hypothetical protein JW940_05780 [Polyangiaceae bacterium]|nr:hypothetical protein [Polyangiaceae bacterium]